MVIELEYPVKLGEREISEIKFPERPSLRHMFAGDAYERGSVEYDAAIASSLSGESMELLGQMDLSDWVHVQAMMNAYFTKAYGGGESKKEGDENPPQATP